MRVLAIVIVSMGLFAGGVHAQAETADGRSYGEVIAVEMTGDPSPDPGLVARFNRLLSSIAGSCSQGREWVSDRILHGHQMLVERGGDATLLDVAVGWDRAVANQARPDCPGILAAVLVLLESGV